MQIILVSDRLATARTITIETRHIIGAAFAFVGAVLLVATALYYVTLRHAAEVRLPFLQSLLFSVQQEQTARTQEFMRENLNLMASRLGQIQAQMLHLDTLGDRLANIAGVKPQELKKEAGGEGGLYVPAKTLDAGELRRALDELSREVELKADALNVIEAQLMVQRVQKTLLPTSLPIKGEFGFGSSYGYRADPFNGQSALHEGIDLNAKPGTIILAAAGGVVSAAEYHPQYGNLVEIDHGNDFSSRYAHASKILVKPGQLVKRGQKIAEVGATGRATGPHLHFEVRFKGVPQNPSRFLQSGSGHDVRTLAAASHRH